MIIGIDANEGNVEKRVGVSEYSFELLRYFKEIHLPEVTFQIYLKDKPLSHMPATSDNWQYKVFGPKSFWTQFALPARLYLARPRPDVFFSTTHYAPRFSPVPTVVSVMDLSFLYFPEMFKPSDLYQLRNWTSYSVKKAKKVFTISSSSKNDIIKEYQVHKDTVVVLYPGIKADLSLEPHVYGMKQLQTKYGISNKFILFVGTLQPRKNISRLIEAFKQVLSSKNQIFGIEELELVIIGKKGWLYEEILAAPGKFGIEDRVKFLHTVPDEDLTVFYKHALCYVLPSLYEGFGLPVLEAMQYGCPVITSNISSLPEAGGDAALYVDPMNVNDIADKLMKLIDNEKLRKELVEKGKKQIMKFSWEKSAREALRVLEEVAKK